MNRRMLAALAFTLFACGGSQPAATPPASDTAPKDAADAGSAAPAASTAAPASTTPATPEKEKSGFDALPADKKVEIMATKVVPNVGKLFKEHDAAKFGKFGCATCHGPTKKDDPHNVVPKLTFSNGGLEKYQKAKPEMMKFMSEKVTPTMAAALGEKPFDPATKQGFGCAGCHKID